jgi:hypothetical protein
MKIKSIINWELWYKFKVKEQRIDTEYKFKKREKMKGDSIEVCLGVGINQLFPEYVKIDIPQRSTREEYEEREKLLAEMMKYDQDLGLYDDLPHPKNNTHNDKNR